MLRVLLPPYGTLIHPILRHTIPSTLPLTPTPTPTRPSILTLSHTNQHTQSSGIPYVNPTPTPTCPSLLTLSHTNQHTQSSGIPSTPPPPHPHYPIHTRSLILTPTLPLTYTPSQDIGVGMEELHNSLEPPTLPHQPALRMSQLETLEATIHVLIACSRLYGELGKRTRARHLLEETLRMLYVPEGKTLTGVCELLSPSSASDHDPSLQHDHRRIDLLRNIPTLTGKVTHLIATHYHVRH